MSCRLMYWRDSGKGAVTCALLWMRSMILRPGCRGLKVGEILVYVGLECGAGLHSAWLGFLRLVGWQSRKINMINHILLNLIEISYSGYFSS